jgi:predicted RNase H-like nuclease (RuvC/YqgF family)
MVSTEIIVEIGSVLGAIGTVLGTLWKVRKDLKRDKDAQLASILKEAKELDNTLKIKLEAKIEALRAEFKNMEFNFSKDMSHLKETQSSEMKNLGQKIEALRSELQNQHAQYMQLLTELVKRKTD